MNSFLKICGLAASLQFLGIQALEAATLSIDPSTQNVTVGNPVSVDVKVGDLGGTQVGTYDFILSYEPTLLTLSDLSFGSYLGYDLDSLWYVIDDSSAGTLNVIETSLLLDLSGQPTDPFTLFSVTFSTHNTGLASLSLTGNISSETSPSNFLGDEWGDPLPVDLQNSLLTASIDIQARPSGNIPEPSSLLLMILGIPLLLRRFGKNST